MAKDGKKMAKNGKKLSEFDVFNGSHCILWIQWVRVHPKLGMILKLKWFKNWSYQKIILTKKCAPI